MKTSTPSSSSTLFYVTKQTPTFHFFLLNQVFNPLYHFLPLCQVLSSAYQHLILPQISYPIYLYLLLPHHFITMLHYSLLQITNPTYSYIILIQVFNPTYLLFHFLLLFNPVYHFFCLHLSLYIPPLFSQPLPLLPPQHSTLYPNVSLLTRLSPFTSLSSFSQSSASSSCSIKPSINFACPIPLSYCFQLTSSNSIKIYLNTRSILPKLDEISALCSVLNPDLHCGILAIC